MKQEKLRIIDSSEITDVVEKLFVKANTVLPDKIEAKLHEAYSS